MKYGVLALMLFAWPTAWSDEITDIYVVRCKQFMQENPVITATTDEMGLVGAWQSINGLKGCIELWGTNKDVFLRPGKNELREWMIHRRLGAYVRYLNFVNDDPVVESLVVLVRLHAEIGGKFMTGRVDAGTYLAVASSVFTAGRHQAEQIEARYGKGRRVIKRPKVVPW